VTKHEPHPGLTGYKETGMASYYAKKLHNRKTGSSERFDNNAMTAAHKTFVEITNK
jgi:rare lipoprotein A